MARVWNDWAWRPDLVTREALRRGVAKARGLRLRRETEYCDFSRPARLRRPSQRALARRRREQEVVTRYYIKRESETRVTTTDIVEKANERKADSERARARREGRNMSWATVLILEGAKTRVWRRYSSLTLATRAVNHEPEFAKAPDHMIVHQGTIMGSLTDEELAAMVREAKLKPSDPRPQQLLDLKEWLAKFGSEFDSLSQEAEEAADEEDEKFRRQRNGGKLPTSTSPERAAAKRSTRDDDDPKEGTRVAKGKKAAGPAAKKGKAKVVAKSRKANGDGLGKEGTITRFICEGIMRKEDDAKLLAAARKKFPKNKVRDYYVSWYRARLKKSGVYKG